MPSSYVYIHVFVNARYSSVITCQRAMCVVMLCWVGSVLSSFGQFIGSDVLDVWKSQKASMDIADHGLHDNWTSSIPLLTPSPPSKYPPGREVIAQNLPYGGFLSKFIVEDMHNFTYAEFHSSHWGVCAGDTILSPEFLVYVHVMTVFMLPLLCLLAIYLDLLCIKPRKTSFSHADPLKRDSRQARSLPLSLSLLVLLCLPLHICHALFLFTPSTILPAWSHEVAMVFYQLYSLVPPILFTPPKKQVGVERTAFPLSVSCLPPSVAPSRGKSVRVALCEAVQAAPWSSAKHSLKAKVCPEVWILDMKDQGCCFPCKQEDQAVKLFPSNNVPSMFCVHEKKLALETICLQSKEEYIHIPVCCRLLNWSSTSCTDIMNNPQMKRPANYQVPHQMSVRKWSLQMMTATLITDVCFLSLVFLWV